MELSQELESLLAGGLASTAEKVALLRFFRLHRGAVWYPQLVSHQGALLRAAGEGAVGEDYWAVLEQTLTSSLQCHRSEEAHACLAALQVRFGIFQHGKPSAVEGESGTPQSGSLRVRFLELLVLEWEAMHGGGRAAGDVAARGGAHPGSAGGGSGSSSSSGGGGGGGGGAQLANLEKGVKKDYAELAELKPTGGGASLRRLAVLDSSPRAALVRLLETHLGDAPSWQELAELYAKDGAPALPQAIHCYEELVLLAPNQAGWHARLADLHAALHAAHPGSEAAAAGLRQARLHAAEAVRLSEGGVAYAVAALADAAYLHALSVLAGGAGAGGSADGRPLRSAVPKEHRLLPGAPLSATARALADLSAAAGAAGADAAAAAAAARAPAVVTLPPALEGAKLRAVEESLALHALACAYLEGLRGGEGSARCAALAGKAPIPHALCGPEVAAGRGWLELFPALAVEGELVAGAHARGALAAQCSLMKGLAAALAGGAGGGAQ